MAMMLLLKRQAPGRDFHKHFSLAPARSDSLSLCGMRRPADYFD
jgi:hypothetical protein